MAKLVYTDQSGRELSVPIGPDSPVVTVGRAKDCTIRSNRKSVSRRHAEFQYNDGRYEVVDLDSSNGTYVIVDDRRKPVANPETLSHNDEVWCGDFILYFVKEGADVAAAGQEPMGGGVQNNIGGTPGLGDQPSVSSGSGNAPSMSTGNNSPPPVSVGGAASEASPPQPGGGQPAQVPSRGTEPPQNFDRPAGSPQGGSTQAVDDGELERLRDEKKSIQQLADRQSRKIDELQEELERIREQHEETRRNADDQSRQVDRLSEQLDQQKKRNADLEEQLELARQDAMDAQSQQGRASELEQQLRDANQQVQQLESELSNRDSDMEMLQRELERESNRADSLQSQLREVQSRVDDLEAEKSALETEVQRIRGERDSARQQLNEARSAGGEQQVEQLQARIDELEAELSSARSASAANGLDDASTEQLAERARTLDRIVDAIERTDLSPLSTVDRVRLESAIRDTKPRQTLSEMLELVGAEGNAEA